MSPRQLKAGYFALEGINSFATVYYCFYLYFFMQKTHGFDNRANLCLAALSGFVYMGAAWWGGRFAQRRGNFTSLKAGYAVMAAAMAIGSQLSSATGQVGVMVLMLLGMACTWPALEAMVSEGETPAGLPRALGIYNVVWAATGALSYFLGGALLEHLGMRSLFWAPGVLFLLEFAIVFRLEAAALRVRPVSVPAQAAELELRELNPRPIARALTFKRLAWWANPFGYIAANTIIAFIPGVASRLHLSTTLAGFCCSIWCFARLAAFAGLWSWTGWHYRFRWLFVAYLGLIAAFAAILSAPSLVVLVLAQVVFGVSIGLLYYSSLFYSMDLSESKSEHGGIHEAAIGLGNCLGPALGAGSIALWPGVPASSVVAVSGLLLVGLAGLVGIQRGNWWKA